jgi:lysophospholipid acyltransferase (LPLAT)-like uncharacterized protein
VLFGFKRWETIKELIAKDAQAPYVYMVIMFRLLHWTNCNKLRGKKKHIGKFRVFGFSINQFWHGSIKYPFQEADNLKFHTLSFSG